MIILSIYSTLQQRTMDNKGGKERTLSVSPVDVASEDGAETGTQNEVSISELKQFEKAYFRKVDFWLVGFYSLVRLFLVD